MIDGVIDAKASLRMDISGLVRFHYSIHLSEQL